jgi:DNA modification methylase
MVKLKKEYNKYLSKNFYFNLTESDVLEALNRIDDNSLDLIITSPPYNIGKDYEKENKMSASEYFEWQKNIIKICFRKLKDTGSICWQVGYNNQNGSGKEREYYPLEYSFYPIFKEIGFIMKNRIIWAFGLGAQNKQNFSSRHEVVMWFVKSEKYKFELDNMRVPPKYPGKQSSLKFYSDGSRNEKYGEVSTTVGGKNPEDVWVNSRTYDFWEIPSVKSHHPEKIMRDKEYEEILDYVKTKIKVTGNNKNKSGEIYKEILDIFEFNCGEKGLKLSKFYEYMKKKRPDISKNTISYRLKNLDKYGIIEGWGTSGDHETIIYKGRYWRKKVPAHPCQFPTALTSRLILGLTNEDDLVLDPFCGLGTTGVSCALTNRRFIGIDRSSEYLKYAKGRIEEILKGDDRHIREDKPVADHKKSYLWTQFDFDKWELKKKV